MADQPNLAAAAPVLPPHPDFAKPPVGANGAPAPAPAAQPNQTAAPAPSAPAAPVTASLPIEQLQHYLGLERQLADYQAQKQAEIDAKEQERILALAKAGESEQALEEQKKIWQSKQLDAEKKYKDLESQVCNEKADAELSQALSGQVFAGSDDASRSAAAKMLKTILRNDIEAVRDAAGSIVVRDKASGRPAADVIRERLSDPTLAFFFAPNSRGGSGSDGTRPPANPQQSQPGSLEAIAAEFKAKQGQYGGMGLHPLA